MYKRSIFHILTPLGIVLLLFLFYQAVLKPQFFPVLLNEHLAPPVVVEAVETAPPSPPVETRKDDLPAARAIDQTVAPETQQKTELEAIRDAIEAGNLSAAESQLTAVRSDQKVAPYVAILWNNLGLQQERLYGPSVSVKAFKRAAGLDAQNAVVQLNLAHAYWALRDPALNDEFLTNLMALAPKEPFPHLAMADHLSERDRFSDALVHLTQATERINQDPALQSYLTMVTAKVRRADAAETNMLARNSTHFTVKFDGQEDAQTWTTVLDILEDAYRDIGQRFGHFPSKPIVVVLHTKDHFQSATGSPVWADGLFDPVLGRIQIPTQGATTDTKWLTSVLRHEYVHALLHDRLGPSNTSLPLWLNEGLAMQWAGTDWPDLNQAMPSEVKVIPLQYLEGSWGHLPHNVAALA